MEVSRIVRMTLMTGIWIGSLLASGASSAQTGRLSLVNGAMPSRSASPGHPGLLNELAPAAFKRVGADVEVSTQPAERVMISVNAGQEACSAGTPGRRPSA